MANISTAQTEYYRRPEDQRYPSVDAMIQAARDQKIRSVTKTINAKEITARPAINQAGRVDLIGPGGNPATLSHWAFGQLAGSIGAPAGYLRRLPPDLSCQLINHGLQNTPPASDLNLLFEMPTDEARNQGHYATVRAATSETYGRVWDADIYGRISSALMQSGRFHLPPTWDGKPAGAYRSDRDSFLILVNGGSIVKDPSLAGMATYGSSQGSQGSGTRANDSGAPDGLYRGLIVRNSEVGASSIVIDQILFRYICGNHMLWGAVIGKSFTRRHVGENTLRHTIREIESIAFNWTNASASRDEKIIQSLISHEIATTRQGVIDELRKIGFSKADAEAAYDTCARTESVSPRSFWGIAQGTTRASQQGDGTSSNYQDDRFSLDQLAAKVLQKGARMYATV